MAARQVRVPARALGKQRRILRQRRVRAHRAGRSTARSAAPAASAATRARPFTSNQRSFLCPAHTCPTETHPRAPPVEPHQHGREILALNAKRLSPRCAGAAQRLRPIFAGLIRVGITVREIGEHRLDAPADDMLDEIAPMRSDVADGRALAALFRLEAPGEIGGLQQPVLQVRAVDEVRLAQLACRDHLAGLLHQRIAAIVERHGVHDARFARRIPQATRASSAFSASGLSEMMCLRCVSAAMITGTCR